jgi:nucleoside-diphosphate-sugar epimerase
MDDANPGTVLVTGAFGQVGSRCTAILLSRGRTVVALDLPGDNSVAVAARLSEHAAPGTLVPAYVDLTDAAAIRDLVTEHQPSAIVHLAGILAPVSYRNPKLARKVNVGGTRNVVDAATALAEPPLFVEASSASVYGSVNPYRYPEPITPDTPIKPIDQYGEDKMLAEAIIRESGLPYAMLRLGGVISPDAATSSSADHLVLTRATPGDNRMHTVDARDVALAFANAVDRGDAINGKVLLIAGDDTHRRTQRDLEDDMMEAIGIGRLGPSASLPGDPEDDRGWAFTGFFDTTESQALLDFQRHPWSETTALITESQRRLVPVLRVLGPLLRPLMRMMLKVQRRVEHRGRYADPWTLIEKKYGADVLAATDA